MKYAITGKEMGKLQKIAKRITIQSHEHRTNIITYFQAMIAAARIEFNEDNDPTLQYFLMDCFKAAIKAELKYPHNPNKRNQALLSSENDLNDCTQYLKELCNFSKDKKQMVELRNGSFEKVQYTNNRDGEGTEGFMTDKGRWNPDGSSFTSSDYDIVEIHE
jgi:flagellar motility protein MotE (MotC chaperone)